jgi:nucleotide-binding universal stress UspA family protein
VKGDAEMKRILVAYDGSEASHKALLEAVGIAHQYGAQVTVASAVPNLCFYGMSVDCSSVETLYRSEAEGILAGAKLALQDKGVYAESVVLDGSPADAIVDYAKERGIEMIVVGSTGKHATRRTLLGSVSSKIAANAPCMVLIVK